MSLYLLEVQYLHTFGVLPARGRQVLPHMAHVIGSPYLGTVGFLFLHSPRFPLAFLIMSGFGQCLGTSIEDDHSYPQVKQTWSYTGLSNSFLHPGHFLGVSTLGTHSYPQYLQIIFVLLSFFFTLTKCEITVNRNAEKDGHKMCERNFLGKVLDDREKFTMLYKINLHFVGAHFLTLTVITGA